jgi:hypothetical protein
MLGRLITTTNKVRQRTELLMVILSFSKKTYIHMCSGRTYICAALILLLLTRDNIKLLVITAM